MSERVIAMFDTILELMIDSYPYLKSFHIISVITWMAGLFYLPRLFVYHAETAVTGDERDEMLQVMERKLLRLIMNPAMIATWIFGVALVLIPGMVDWMSIWPYTKLSGILVLTWFHHWLGKRRKDFVNDTNVVSGRMYRIMNELPTIFLILVVFSVVVKF